MICEVTSDFSAATDSVYFVFWSLLIFYFKPLPFSLVLKSAKNVHSPWITVLTQKALLQPWYWKHVRVTGCNFSVDCMTMRSILCSILIYKQYDCEVLLNLLLLFFILFHAFSSLTRFHLSILFFNCWVP